MESKTRGLLAVLLVALAALPARSEDARTAAARTAAARIEAATAAFPPVVVEGAEEAPESAAGIQSLLTQIVRDNVPLEYEDDRKWGKQKQIVSGLKLRREGLRIETKRRRKHVNHGTWKRYRIRLIDPSEHLRVRVENYQQLPNGVAKFDLVLDAKLLIFARLSQWQTGVQLVSVSSEAESGVRMRLGCEVSLKLDIKQLPPDVLLNVKVDAANLELRDFRLKSISDVRGPLAKRLSSSVREVLEDVIEKKRHKMVEKINRQIAKNEDKLRLSLRDMLNSPWSDAAKFMLPK